MSASTPPGPFVDDDGDELMLDPGVYHADGIRLSMSSKYLGPVYSVELTADQAGILAREIENLLSILETKEPRT